MRLKPGIAKKIASLSAVGAGALVTAADEAQASVIHIDVVPDSTVGFSPGANSFFSTTRASFGGIGFSMFGSGCGCIYSGSNVILGGGLNGVEFAHVLGQLATFNPGDTFGGASASPLALVAGRSWFQSGSSSSSTYTSHGIFGNNPFSNQYALFRFLVGADFHYGWVQLSLVNPDEFGPGIGPDLTIHAWGFNTTPNEIIAAGDIGNEVPEPSSLALAGLGALALGAAGIRRWREARKQTAPIEAA